MALKVWGGNLAQRIRLSEHAKVEARRRQLEEAVVLDVARTPEQRLPVRAGREVRQSRVADRVSGKLQLIRVIVDSDQDGVTIVTVYRTMQAPQVLENAMKVRYDAKTDTLTVIFRDVPVAESDEEKPGVILDYDAAGNIVSIEVLDASRRVEEPRKVTLSTEG